MYLIRITANPIHLKTFSKFASIKVITLSQANHMSVSVRPTNALPFSTMREKVDQSQMDRSDIEGFECVQNEGIGYKPNSNGDFDRTQ